MAEPKVRFRQDDGNSYPAWQKYSISDLFTKVTDKNKDCATTNVITNSAEYGLIPQRDYFDKDIAVEGKTDNYTIIQTGDFVYNPRKSSYAPMGPFNCYRLEEDGIVSPLYSCLRPKGVLNPEYLLWYFQSDKWYGYVNDNGAQNGARHDRVGMTDKILMGIPVVAPCLEEQQKIADFLASVDEVIATSEEEVANLETQKKAVMKKIFSQEVRFKRADGTDFPEWEYNPFEEIASLMTASIDPSKAGTMHCVELEHLEQGSGQRLGFVEVENQSSNKRLFKTGDVLFGKLRPYLRKYWLATEDGCCSTEIWVLRPLSGVLSEYLLAIVSSDDFISVANTSEGTKMPRASWDLVANAEFPVPSFEEQRLIADFLSDIDEAIAAAKKELELWKELKKGLLQQMFV